MNNFCVRQDEKKHRYIVNVTMIVKKAGYGHGEFPLASGLVI